MKVNNNKKGSNARKLIPAVGMLSVSAVMLATSTYAWFTMSKEVEVKNIQMTATVPEDIQISLGAIGSASEANSLVKNGGFLSTDANGLAVTPASDYDWSNIADISNYYAFGKLIPASSTDGANIFFTPDASGVGRTMKTGATFYQAAAGKTATSESSLGTGAGSGKLNATAHIFKDAADKTDPTGEDAVATSWLTKTGEYKASTAWNNTGDDGYYMDIPVWLRTSSSNTQNIYVYGYVCDKTEEHSPDNGDDKADDLYKAVRVAILQTGTTTGDDPVETYSADLGCLTLADGGDTLGTQNDTARAGMYPTNSDSPNILDSDNYNGASPLGRVTGKTGIYAVSALNEDEADGNHGAWATISQNNATTAIATLAKGTGATFGAPTKVIVRVWLEGEDGNCWNANAGQDWNISLKFTKDPLTVGYTAPAQDDEP